MPDLVTRRDDIMTSVIFVLGARIICKACRRTHGCVKDNIIKFCSNCESMKEGKVIACTPNEVSLFESYWPCGCKKKKSTDGNQLAINNAEGHDLTSWLT